MQLSKTQWLHFASTASVVVAVLLVGSKLVAWWVTGSVSVMASLLDSLMDVMASVINWVAIRMSLVPADDEHRFGHGKIESLAGVAQSMFISGSAFLLLLHASEQLAQQQPLQQPEIGIGVMIFSIVLTLALLMIQKAALRHTGSVAIQADSLHYSGDLFMNLSVIVALVLANFGFPGSDPVFALGIAVYLLYNAWKVGKTAVQDLMDRELDAEDIKRIEGVLNNAEDIEGFHDLRTRQSGQTRFIQLHLELKGELPLCEAHKITDRLEQEIRELHQPAEVMIHQDPV